MAVFRKLWSATILTIGLIINVLLEVSECRYIAHSAYGNGGMPFPLSAAGLYGAPQHFQSTVFSPPATFYDKRKGILRSFPGGGVPILVDYFKRCSGNYVGIKAHPEQNQYYYVCKPDCVVFGKCQNLQTFDKKSHQCIPYSTLDFVPSCTKEGRFPIPTDCKIYYKCESDMLPRIYSCPVSMIFSPMQSKCIPGNRCAPTQISTDGNHIPENCEQKFPPCLQNGAFRSPSDCSLYYNCTLQSNDVYLQTRFKCPAETFYDAQKGKCLPQHQVPCDCIQVAELVYPKIHETPLLPCLYPPYYSSDSLEDNEYPTEDSLACAEDEGVSVENASISDEMASSGLEDSEDPLSLINPPNEIPNYPAYPAIPTAEVVPPQHQPEQTTNPPMDNSYSSPTPLSTTTTPTKTTKRELEPSTSDTTPQHQEQSTNLPSGTSSTPLPSTTTITTTALNEEHSTNPPIHSSSSSPATPRTTIQPEHILSDTTPQNLEQITNEAIDSTSSSSPPPTTTTTTTTTTEQPESTTSGKIAQHQEQPRESIDTSSSSSTSAPTITRQPEPFISDSTTTQQDQTTNQSIVSSSSSSPPPTITTESALEKQSSNAIISGEKSQEDSEDEEFDEDESKVKAADVDIEEGEEDSDSDTLPIDQTGTDSSSSATDSPIGDQSVKTDQDAGNESDLNLPIENSLSNDELKPEQEHDIPITTGQPSQSDATQTTSNTDTINAQNIQDIPDETHKLTNNEKPDETDNDNIMETPVGFSKPSAPIIADSQSIASNDDPQSTNALPEDPVEGHQISEHAGDEESGENISENANDLENSIHPEDSGKLEAHSRTVNEPADFAETAKPDVISHTSPSSEAPNDIESEEDVGIDEGSQVKAADVELDQDRDLALTATVQPEQPEQFISTTVQAQTSETSTVLPVTATSTEDFVSLTSSSSTTVFPLTGHSLTLLSDPQTHSRSEEVLSESVSESTTPQSEPSETKATGIPVSSSAASISSTTEQMLSTSTETTGTPTTQFINQESIETATTENLVSSTLRPIVSNSEKILKRSTKTLDSSTTLSIDEPHESTTNVIPISSSNAPIPTTSENILSTSNGTPIRQAIHQEQQETTTTEITVSSTIPAIQTNSEKLLRRSTQSIEMDQIIHEIVESTTHRTSDSTTTTENIPASNIKSTQSEEIATTQFPSERILESTTKGTTRGAPVAVSQIHTVEVPKTTENISDDTPSSVSTELNFETTTPVPHLKTATQSSTDDIPVAPSSPSTQAAVDEISHMPTQEETTDTTVKTEGSTISETRDTTEHVELKAATTTSSSHSAIESIRASTMPTIASTELETESEFTTTERVESTSSVQPVSHMQHTSTLGPLDESVEYEDEESIVKAAHVDFGDDEESTESGDEEKQETLSTIDDLNGSTPKTVDSSTGKRETTTTLPETTTTTTTTSTTTTQLTPTTSKTILKFHDSSIQIESDGSQRTSPKQKHPVTISNSFVGTKSESPRGKVPKLELLVKGDLDLQIIYCPPDCKNNHNHTFAPATKDRVVQMKWIPRASNKTISLETAP